MTERTYRRLSRLPMNQWGAALSKLRASELSELERMATADAVLLVRLAEYAGTRGGYGCGDHGHTDAVRAQNRKARRVRKAIGYTYAGNDISFAGESQAKGGAR